VDSTNQYDSNNSTIQRERHWQPDEEENKMNLRNQQQKKETTKRNWNDVLPLPLMPSV
jgi:hypothetical protein